MKSMKAICVFLLLSLFSVSHAAQVRRLTLSWTSDGSGNATVSKTFAGTIIRVVTDPGSPAPTDNYDLVLTDANGADLFVGRGADRDTTTTEQFCPGITLSDGTNNSVIPVVCIGTSTLSVSNAGSAKVGAVIIYYIPTDVYPEQ